MRKGRPLLSLAELAGFIGDAILFFAVLQISMRLYQNVAAVLHVSAISPDAASDMDRGAGFFAVIYAGLNLLWIKITGWSQYRKPRLRRWSLVGNVTAGFTAACAFMLWMLAGGSPLKKFFMAFWGLLCLTKVLIHLLPASRLDNALPRLMPERMVRSARACLSGLQHHPSSLLVVLSLVMVAGCWLLAMLRFEDPALRISIWAYVILTAGVCLRFLESLGEEDDAPGERS